MTSTQPPATSQLDSTNELGENEADENHEWKPALPLLTAETGCHRWPVFADKNASRNRNGKLDQTRNNMKHNLLIKLCLFFLIMPDAFAQGIFQNLGFEAAQNIPAPSVFGGYMSPSDALPGWSCYIGTNQASFVTYNLIALDSATIGLISVDSTSYSTESFQPPSDIAVGRYYLSLQYGFSGPGYDAVSIAQTAQLPANIHSIQFRGTYPLSISFNGTSIPLVVLSSQTDYNIYGGDMSQFAGQTGDLAITSYSHFAYLDAIQFSTQSVPEPSGLALFVIGFGMLYCHSWRLK